MDTIEQQAASDKGLDAQREIIRAIAQRKSQTTSVWQCAMSA